MNATDIKAARAAAVAATISRATVNR